MNTLNEYNRKEITTQEFEQWKSTWHPGQEIPEAVHQYMRNVVLPNISKCAKELLSTLK